jgi:drug/metabolite transporter (DMT)-like permease
MVLEQAPTAHLLGAFSALGSAFFWALAAILFRRVGDHVPAAGLNYSKGIIAFICLGALLLVTETTVVDSQSLLYLAVSGLIGICLGDSLYFVTLVRLGPRLTLLLGSLIPVVAGLVAVFGLQEHINPLSATGLGMTIIGVAYVLWEKAPHVDRQAQSLRWLSGVMLGLLFVCSEAAGIIFTKIGVQEMPSLQATFIRQTIAIMGLTFWGLASSALVGWVQPLQERRIRRRVIIAAIVGAFLGTWLSVLALKSTYTSVAAALNSTSPLFVLPLAAYIMREKISRRAILGTAMSVLGIAVYFFTLP